MRKKKAAKMAMESKIPAKPSSMAPYFLNLPIEDMENESEESNMDEDLSVSTSLSDDEAGVGVNESREGKGNSVEEQEKFNGSVVPGSAKIELLKERTCIVCDKVGPLLVCSSHQCPSSYHQKCLPASPSSDDLGKFYCPHCSYQRANAESNRAFEKYRQAKYALFRFLNGMDGERKKQEAQEAVAKNPNPSSHATAEDDAISNSKLEKGVYEFESKKNGQEKDIINEHGRNIQHNTEAHETALNGPDESQHLDDHEFAEMAGYQKESELNKVLTKRNCESTEMSGEHGREEEASFSSVAEFTEFSADSLRMVKKVDIESDSDVSSSDNVPLTMLQKKLVAQRTEMKKMGRLSNLKVNNMSSSDQNSSMEDGRKEEASLNPVESEFTESSADSLRMMKKADIESDSDISSSDHEPLTKRQKKLVAQQTEMIKKGRLSTVKANKASLSYQKSSMEENAGEKPKSSETRIGALRRLRASGGHEREEKTPSDSAQYTHMLDSMEMPKKTGTDSDISDSDREIQELEKTNKSQIFNYFTYQMALEKEKVKGTKIEEVHSKSKHVQSFWKRSKTLILSGGRRQKLLWSAEEKEMLKEGVLKFSTTTNKNLPWQKILDFGHNVFDKTRTPTDLKDKWRNMVEETPTEN